MPAWPCRVATRSRVEGRQRFGQHHGYGPEPQRDRGLSASMSMSSMVRRLIVGGSLGVEQHEQSGDAVLGVEGVVVQQPSGLVPAVVVVQRAGRAGPSGGGELQVGADLLRDRPADEVAGLGPVADVAAGQPGVEVALTAGGQGEPAGGAASRAGRWRRAPGGGPRRTGGRWPRRRGCVAGAGAADARPRSGAAAPWSSGVACSSRVWVTHRWIRASCSSRAGSAPVATSTLRRCRRAAVSADLVEGGVGERTLSGGELGQHRPDRGSR